MNKSAFSLTFLIAVLIAMSPFAVWQAFLGDPLYDSVFKSSFGALPVLKAGRVMPVSSASADILKSLNGKSDVEIAGKKASATKWLWALSSDSKKVDAEKILKTDNKDLQAILGVSGRYFSYNDLAKNYARVKEAAQSEGNKKLAFAAREALEKRIAYETATNAFTVKLPGEKSATKGIKKWEKAFAEASAELKAAREQKREPDHAKLVAASSALEYLRNVSAFEKAYPDATVNSIKSAQTYSTPAEVMLNKTAPKEAKTLLVLYAKISDAISAGDNNAAYKNLLKVNEILSQANSGELLRLKIENITNFLSPFFGGFILYFCALAAFGLSEIFSSQEKNLRGAAEIFMLFAVGLQILGIALRMYIQMRPPVTNLYSSIVFAGAIAAAGGAFLYYHKKYISIGIAGSLCGLISLLIAINLPYSGDTMGIMRAVLNSNFWLTIHVVTIMVGYCGIFLAGFLAQIRLLGNLFSKRNFGAQTGETARTVYAVLCFSLLFTFAGTMLGGIWADMSWGRFWGWDPKENGALMAVLWTAASIHAKTMRLCSDRVFLGFAVIGNIVGAWGWFGVNLMGVGLHAYGFIEGGWFWFYLFVISQILILPLCFYRYKGNFKKISLNLLKKLP